MTFSCIAICANNKYYKVEVDVNIKVLLKNGAAWCQQLT